MRSDRGSKISWQCDRAGEYWIRVRAFSTQDHGYYTVHLTTVEQADSCTDGKQNVGEEGVDWTVDEMQLLFKVRCVTSGLVGLVDLVLVCSGIRMIVLLTSRDSRLERGRVRLIRALLFHPLNLIFT